MPNGGKNSTLSMPNGRNSRIEKSFILIGVY
jgi:hypothetical protein